MEKFTQKWAIIALLEDAAEGAEFYYTDFPLHVTLAGVFAADKGRVQLAKELATAVNKYEPFEIVADVEDRFGPNRDVVVMKVKKTPELMSLYQSVYKWLKDSGVTYNSPIYESGGYVPHVTAQKTGSLRQDESRIIKSVSLIDLYPNHNGYQRKIVATVNLVP